MFFIHKDLLFIYFTCKNLSHSNLIKHMFFKPIFFNTATVKAIIMLNTNYNNPPIKNLFSSAITLLLKMNLHKIALHLRIIFIKTSYIIKCTINIPTSHNLSIMHCLNGCAITN